MLFTGLSKSHSGKGLYTQFTMLLYTYLYLKNYRTLFCITVNPKTTKMALQTLNSSKSKFIAYRTFEFEGAFPFKHFKQSGDDEDGAYSVLVKPFGENRPKL